ncbi:MAG: hypothetical protein LT106_18685 [Burkholderiaceae bacterium]|nr:hypothetical protein [Burkholderiaceae bacterium]
MARARNIKPGFFKNEDLAECTPWARLCFVGLWLLADREGRLEDRPRRIKGELFAFDSVEVDPLLQELQKHGFIQRYEVDGLGIIQIVNFGKHQNPHHREPPSDLPPPESPGLDPVGNPPKPEASSPCNDPKARGKPQASPGLSTDESAKDGGETVLIPDSGFLIPDSPSRIPDPGEPSASLRVAPPIADAPPPRPKRERAEARGAPVWEAYALAYRGRYQVEPVRNAKANAQCLQLVDRLGADEAPQVAAFYVAHQKAIYVSRRHALDLLVHDAEALRTDWLTGRQSTQSAATQADRTQQNAGAFGRLIERAQREADHAER